ncbi:ABC transporter phosphate-binding protein [Candidatus Moduliflexus flocculans]|uniref:Phosphate-binding protein n=1 Tax=Candidatus Moduliflexus flocculans TaxID=1499966 RepID=A0A0S6VXP5_9BACT|nr:ABC transporter phosphate-binding protein [Candidatus Moduliflexus flocculans]
MKKLFSTLAAVALFAVGTMASAEITINGAGASFPFPVYSQWAFKYNELTGMKLNYQSIGSGGGIAQIKAKTVDFGASDAPLGIDELNEAGLVQFPMIMGGVVPVVNIKDIAPGALKLSNDVLANIFLGKITKWNDAAIAELNAGVKLPAQDITVVYRSDGSGTTNIFTDYLSKVSAEWKEKIGVGKTVEWPAGVGGKGNEGVAAYVQQVEGSIGYVEYAYALQNKLADVALKNREGNVVNATISSFQSAAANADWQNAPGFALFLTDQPGKDSWPITGVSYILIYKEQANAENAAAMLKFFDWCYTHGADIATGLQYVPMPENVVKMVQQVWTEQVKINGAPAWPAK